MASQRDILRTMMTRLDETSDKIPEGFYLEFCDHLKNIHKHIEPVPCRPVVQNVPFSVQGPVNFSRSDVYEALNEVMIEEGPQPPDIYEALNDLIEEMSGPQPRRRRRPRCGICRNSGHNRRNCPRIGR